jgi:hypothetical protein
MDPQQCPKIPASIAELAVCYDERIQIEVSRIPHLHNATPLRQVLARPLS